MNDLDQNAIKTTVGELRKYAEVLGEPIITASRTNEEGNSETNSMFPEQEFINALHERALVATAVPASLLTESEKMGRRNMIKIHYRAAGTAPGYITWGANEDFEELINYHLLPFRLGAVKAIDIESMDGLSVRSKILLSAVASAVIQFLFDHHISSNAIFETGTFWITREE